MKFIALVLLLTSTPLYAREETCDKGFSIEQQQVSTITAREFFAVANSSGSYRANRRLACLRNLNSTAANHIWVSSFQVTALVDLVLDTSKSFPIPGGNTADAQLCLPLGANAKLWVHTVLGQGSTVAGLICE